MNEFTIGGKDGAAAVAGDGLIIEFMPDVGDVVEFDSDMQTEKGPSSGVCTAVDYSADCCTVRHSDHPGETFIMSKVVVFKYKRHRNHPDRARYWLLK